MPGVHPPEGLTVSQEGDQLVVELRLPPSRRTGALVVALVVGFVVAIAWLVVLIFLDGTIRTASSIALGILSFAALAWSVARLDVAHQRTTVRLGPEHIDSEHDSRSPYSDSRTFNEYITQPFSVLETGSLRGRGRYRVRALLNQPHSWIVASGFHTPEQARYLEGLIAHRLGVADHPVAGELPRAAGDPVAAQPPVQPPASGVSGRRISIVRPVAYLLAMLVSMGLMSLGVLKVTAKEGVKVASLDVVAKGAETPLQLEAGDVLLSYLDLELGGDAVPGNRNLAFGPLYDSEITLTLTAADGSKQTAACAVYNGISGNRTSSPGYMKIKGMHNACDLQVAKAGAHTLHAQVAWQRTSPKVANLEIRRLR